MSSPLFRASPSFVDAQLPADSVFRVKAVRAVLFERLPPKLKTQVAYKHFYTETLDRQASLLSIKFFSLVILYFCTLFKLQGRRTQYTGNQTEKAGRDFAKAHRRVKAVFNKLAACYGVILMRYNTNSTLVLEKKMHRAAAELPSHNRPTSVGLKAPLPAVLRVRAFEYLSDEMLFYENLFQMTAQVVRQAFAGDAALQELATSEANKLFRSNSFLFHDKQRSELVSRTAARLDRSSGRHLLNNSKELAELLTSPVQPLIMKYANQQRTPFMGTRFPGGTNHIHYQRPRPASVLSGSSRARSKVEEAYTFEVNRVVFPPGHRALRTIELLQQQQHCRSLPRSDFKGPAASILQDGAGTAAAGTSVGALCSALEDFDKGSGRDVTTAAAADAHHPKRRTSSNASSAGVATTTTTARMGKPEESSAPGSRSGRDAVVTSIMVGSANKSLISENAVPVKRLLGEDVGSASAEGSNMLAAGRLPSALRDDVLASGVGAMETSLSVATTGSPSPTGARADLFLRILEMPDEKWLEFDLQREIENVYQSLANGIGISSFAIPQDLMVDYGDNGIIQLPALDR